MFIRRLTWPWIESPSPQRLSYLYTLSLWRKAKQYSTALPSLRMFHKKAAKPCWWSSFSRNLPGLWSSIFSNVIDYFSRRRNVYHSLSNEESWAKHRTKSLLWCVWSLGVWYLWSSCCLGAWEPGTGWWNRGGLAGPIMAGTPKGKRGEGGWCKVSSRWVAKELKQVINSGGKKAEVEIGGDSVALCPLEWDCG